MPLMGDDLPEPEWWQHARALAEQGVSRPKIAAALGVAYGSVRYALDPAYRVKTREQTRRWQERNPDYVSGLRNHSRDAMRRQVRQVWRDGGRVNDLHQMYKDAGVGPVGTKRPRSCSDGAQR